MITNGNTSGGPVLLDGSSPLWIGRSSWVLWASNNISSPSSDTCVLFQGPLGISSSGGYMSVIENNSTSTSWMWRNATGQATALTGAGGILHQRCNKVNGTAGAPGLPATSVSAGNASAECYAPLTNTSTGCSTSNTSSSVVCPCKAAGGGAGNVKHALAGMAQNLEILKSILI